ncbi:MAG TPA: multiheme c-type cytochrome [Capsulimonadaceae bacterium]|jgi:hypothetical protein
MKKKYQALFYLLTTLLGVVTMAIVGCGGGGGPITSGGGGTTTPTSPSAAFVALLPAGQAGATLVGKEKCATCHADNATHVAGTLHASKNVSCENCHGPGSAHAAAPAKTNILTFPNVTQNVVCAQCHGPITDQYLGSKHAKPVENFVGLAAPYSNVATCFRCHSGNFRAQYVDGPIGKGKTPAEVDTAILALTEDEKGIAAAGIHATAECVTCHDPHMATTNLLANGEQKQLRRATVNMDATGIGPGATVATYTTYNQMCGSCHNTRGANPADSALSTGTSRSAVHHGPEMNMLLGASGVEKNDIGVQSPARRVGTHASAPDQCVTCHLPNASHTFTVKLDQSCVPCHSPADAAARKTALQNEVMGDLAHLQSELSAWAVAKYGAGNTTSWDYTSNITAGQTVPVQSTVPIEIKRARYNYWYVIIDNSYGVHNPFYTRFMLQIAQDNINELNGTSVPLIVPRAVSSQQLKTFVTSERAREKAGYAHVLN